jgi:microcystin-dependent protein
MFQIDGPDVAATKPVKKPAVNPPGFFQGGDPVENKNATMVTCDFLNTIQEEIANVIRPVEALDRTRDDQLVRAIRKVIKQIAGDLFQEQADELLEEVTNKIDAIPSPDSSFPVGAIIAYYGDTSPGGFIACDGSSFSASGYPKLYKLLGKSTTPDLRGCFLRMLGGQSASLGVKQEDAGRNAAGEFPVRAHDGIAPTTGPFSAKTTERSASWTGYPGVVTVDFDLSRVWGASHIATEFRPTNVAILYCIKHD